MAKASVTGQVPLAMDLRPRRGSKGPGEQLAEYDHGALAMFAGGAEVGPDVEEGFGSGVSAPAAPLTFCRSFLPDADLITARRVTLGGESCASLDLRRCASEPVTHLSNPCRTPASAAIRDGAWRRPG